MEQYLQHTHRLGLESYTQAKITQQCFANRPSGVRCQQSVSRLLPQGTLQFCEDHLHVCRRSYQRYKYYNKYNQTLMTRASSRRNMIASRSRHDFDAFECNTKSDLLEMNRYLIEEIDLRHAYQLMCVCSVDDGHEAWLKKIQGHMEEVNQILQDNCVICCLEQLDTVKQADPKKRVMLASDSVYNSIYESLYTTSDHKDETDIELDDVSDNEVQSFDNSSMSTASDIELDDVQSNDQVKLSNIPQIIERWDDQGWNT